MCERVHTHSQTHARVHAHTMQILVLGGTGPSHIPAGQTRGRHVATCPGTQSQNPKLREKALLLLAWGPQPPHFLFPALSTMTGISRSHCVPSKQTSIPAPPHQSKYCRGHVLKGSPHRALCQRDTKVYRETGRRGTQFRYRGAGGGSVQARSHGGGALS